MRSRSPRVHGAPTGSLDLLPSVMSERSTALDFGTHDLAVVMRGGVIVETAATEPLLRAPSDPCTAELLPAVPRTAGTDTAVQ
jgi:ABC-type dipeptide/oligopeptide/nickel transport system ATPase component